MEELMADLYVLIFLIVLTLASLGIWQGLDRLMDK
jgi:hypothetical protein